MFELAIKGGQNVVPKEFQYFKHPHISINILNYLSSMENIEEVTNFDAEIITRLQNKFKEKFNVKYVLLTNSGTSAIFEMYYSVGLKPGDEVIVPVYTFFATATPLFLLGCVPILVDCLSNGSIDPDDIKRKITSRTRAIIITHMWGIPCDMQAIVDLSKTYDLPVLEDASHAHGAIYGGKVIGSFSTASAWSLGTKKIITGGQGGVLGTNNRSIYEKAMLIGQANNKRLNDVQLKQLIPYSITGTGMNLRMHPYSALVIYDQLLNLNKQLKERREVAEFLNKEINSIPGLTTPCVFNNSSPAWYAFPIFFNEKKLKVSKEKFVAALNAEGALEADIPRSTCPLTQFPLFRQSTVSFSTKLVIDIYKPQQFPNAYEYYNKIFKLPVWYGKKRFEYAQYYINAIKKVVKNIWELH